MDKLLKEKIHINPDYRQIFHLQSLLTEYDRQNNFLNKQVNTLLKENKQLKSINKIKQSITNMNTRSKYNYIQSKQVINNSIQNSTHKQNTAEHKKIQNQSSKFTKQKTKEEIQAWKTKNELLRHQEFPLLKKIISYSSPPQKQTVPKITNFTLRNVDSLSTNKKVDPYKEPEEVVSKQSYLEEDTKSFSFGDQSVMNNQSLTQPKHQIVNVHKKSKINNPNRLTQKKQKPKNLQSSKPFKQQKPQLSKRMHTETQTMSFSNKLQIRLNSNLFNVSLQAKKSILEYKNQHQEQKKIEPQVQKPLPPFMRSKSLTNSRKIIISLGGSRKLNASQLNVGSNVGEQFEANPTKPIVSHVEVKNVHNQDSKVEGRSRSEQRDRSMSKRRQYIKIVSKPSIIH